MAIFNCYVSSPEGTFAQHVQWILGDEYLEVWAEAGWSREDRPGQLDEDPLTHLDAKPFRYRFYEWY